MSDSSQFLGEYSSEELANLKEVFFPQSYIDQAQKEVDDILVECNTQKEFETHLKFIESDMDPNEYDDRNQYESALRYHQEKYNLLLIEGSKKGFKV